VTDALRMSRSHADDIVRHCLRGRPNEACGILAARNGEVVDVLPMSNAAQSPLRYALDPKEQLVAYRMLADKGWDLGAVFHSHTRTEAFPSPTDIRLASEDVPYLIVSLAREPPSMRAFRIRKESWDDVEGEVAEVLVEVRD
jgi:proteasome lid subunit RPN8/RPN11